MDKQCFKCGERKTHSEFYKHPMMGDGRLGKCITCTKRDVREREQFLRTHNPAWLARERKRCRAKQERARKNGTASPTKQEYRDKWGRLNLHKLKAQQQAHRALKRGLIKKPDACMECGIVGVELEKHHPDYSKPLDIRWLCTPCHGTTRRKV